MLIKCDDETVGLFHAWAKACGLYQDGVNQDYWGDMAAAMVAVHVRQKKTGAVPADDKLTVPLKDPPANNEHVLDATETRRLAEEHDVHPQTMSTQRTLTADEGQKVLSNILREITTRLMFEMKRHSTFTDINEGGQLTVKCHQLRIHQRDVVQAKHAITKELAMYKDEDTMWHLFAASISGFITPPPGSNVSSIFSSRNFIHHIEILRTLAAKIDSDHLSFASYETLGQLDVANVKEIVGNYDYTIWEGILWDLQSRGQHEKQHDYVGYKAWLHFQEEAVEVDDPEFCTLSAEVDANDELLERAYSYAKLTKKKFLRNGFGRSNSNDFRWSVCLVQSAESTLISVAGTEIPSGAYLGVYPCHVDSVDNEGRVHIQKRDDVGGRLSGIERYEGKANCQFGVVFVNEDDSED